MKFKRVVSIIIEIIPIIICGVLGAYLIYTGVVL